MAEQQQQQQHSITPPSPELVERWIKEPGGLNAVHIATQAARWGADQELEACCEILRGEFNYHHLAEPLRAARRPKPPSLAEQALADLDSMSIEPCLINGIDVNAAVRAKYDNIRRALERLQHLEQESNDN